MAGYIYISNGLENEVQNDLNKICPDTGLFFRPGNLNGVDYIEIVYTPLNPQSFGCQVLNNVINNNSWGGDIFILGVPSSESFPWFGPITEKGAITKRQNGSRASTTDIIIIYDVGFCNGEGYVTYDSANICIAIPRPVILLHELAHAQYPRGAEDQAMADENTFRSERGMAIRATHNGSCFSFAHENGACPVNPNL